MVDAGRTDRAGCYRRAVLTDHRRSNRRAVRVDTENLGSPGCYPAGVHAAAGFDPHGIQCRLLDIFTALFNFDEL